jgi:DNA-directed RNA polymerase subunit L
MNIRLQTYENAPAAVDVLKEGLKDMEKAADILDDKFTAALTRFRR